jgi:osmotically-inducible protein OsmY
MKTNEDLKRDVIDELNWEPTVIDGIVTPNDNFKIEVSVVNGVVTLDGEVDSYARKWSAYRAVRRIVGVKEVVDNTKVKLPDYFKLADEEISRGAIHAIALNASIPKDSINVKVHDGSITLTGEVDWAYQREAAKEIIYHLKGVGWVDDQITIKPVEPVDLKAKIESAFRRNALVDSNRIRVEIQGGEVILRGSVQSWTEKEEALRIVWAARGVSEIDDHILINSLEES